MKTDLYTKAVLTVIAFLLLLTACEKYVNPPAAVRAEGPFAGVMVFGHEYRNYGFFDTRTGDLWELSLIPNATHPGWYYEGRVTKLGQPLVK